MSIGELESELDALMPKQFVDRDELRSIIIDSIHALEKDSTYHHVIAIYGMGGIGKSRILTEIKNHFAKETFSHIELIHASLELESDNMFHSLLCIRRGINHICPLFDYALVLFLDRCTVEMVSLDFLRHLQANWGTDAITFLQGASPIPLPSLNDAIQVLNYTISKAIQKHTKRLHKSKIQKLEAVANTAPKKLLSLLPTLLGCDLCYISERNHKLVIILDSCNGCSSWLDNLLFETAQGVFILTSRDPLHFAHTQATPYHMQEIPDEDAEKYLKFYIENAQHQTKLIPSLISVTECIPLYLDLAVSTYLRCRNDSAQDIINALSFKNKDALTEAFLNHLPTAQQELILVLAVVGIFDTHIFMHLVDDLNLSVSKLGYHDLCQISLVDSLNASCELKTFHNIFRHSVTRITCQEKRCQIFQSYLLFLSHRAPYLYPNEVLRIYFINVLHLVLDNKFDLTITENEEILDLFFALNDQQIDLEFLASSQGSENATLFTFLVAITQLHSSLSSCMKSLNSIRDSLSLLGKHKNSYYAVLYYSLSIKGQYSKTKSQLSAICNSLSSDNIGDWYYGKLKIYLADYFMLTGSFKEAIRHFEEYESEIKAYTAIKQNDTFEVTKQKGHCYRFNFLLDKASSIYEGLYAAYACNSAMKGYCLTCLCETKCFFDPEYVIQHYQEALAVVRATGYERSRAKIYYSLGISYIVKRDFTNALHYIRQSIQLNTHCGYPAGKLFALVALCYYHYAKSGNIPQNLILQIEDLSTQLEVYGYLLLPVYLMKGNTAKVEMLRRNYHWINWAQTKKKYECFIASLSN